MKNRKPFIIGIAGGSGSGKTSIIRALKNNFPDKDIAVLSQDDYYKSIEFQPRDANGKVNFDLPQCIDWQLLKQHIIDFQSGRPISKTEYTFNTETKTAKEIRINPAPILVIEGLFIFHEKAIQPFFDFKVFIDVDEHEKLRRRLNRDIKERGYSKEQILYQWENHVKPAYTNYLLPYRDQCDLFIDNNISFEKGVSDLAGIIKNQLAISARNK